MELGAPGGCVPGDSRDESPLQNANPEQFLGQVAHNAASDTLGSRVAPSGPNSHTDQSPPNERGISGGRLVGGFVAELQDFLRKFLQLYDETCNGGQE